ncbi:MAG: hypothetical protein ACPGMR_11515 [Pontibacterium sp.]
MSNLVDLSDDAINREVLAICKTHGLDPKRVFDDSVPSAESAIDDELDALFGEIEEAQAEPIGEGSEAPEGEAEPEAETSGLIKGGVWNWSAAKAQRDVTSEEEEAMCAFMIRGGVYTVFKLFFRSAPVDDELITEFARRWARVICKYYTGGVLELFARFQEEGMAILATLAIIQAIRAPKQVPVSKGDEDGN